MNKQQLTDSYERYGFKDHEILFFVSDNHVAAIHMASCKKVTCDVYDNAYGNKCLALNKLNDFVDKDERWKTKTC